ncbi:hypothetical protein HK405_014214, partial [Cladochytrium tenue]
LLSGFRARAGDGESSTTLQALMQQLTSEASASERGNPPASKFFVRNLPSVPRDPQAQCPICVEPFSDEAEARSGPPKRLTCRHVYHRDCVAAWLKVHNTCPTCRREMPTDDREYEKKRKAEARRRGYFDEDDEDDDPSSMMYG